MKLFDWLKKQSETFRVVTMYLPTGQGVSSRKDYGQFADEGYGQNSAVHACVRSIAEASACVPWILYERDSKGERREIMDHPILRLLDRPNPLQGQFEFIESLISYLYISGNMFVEGVGPNDNRAAPRELYSLRPDRMKILPSKTDLIAGYEYAIGGESKKFERDQIVHLKLFNPLDDFFGLTPIQVASLAIDKMNEGDKWNSGVLRNSAVPSGAIVARTNLTDQQFDRLKGEMKETMQGALNARKPLLLEDAEWKDIALSPKEMDWLEGLKLSALQVAQIYNVPGELIGLQTATFQNRKEARKALYTEVVIPSLRRLRDCFNNWLTPRFGKRLELDLNLDRVEALSEDNESLWQRANESKILTLNEKRELVGYEPLPEGGVILVPFSETPLSSVVSPASLPGPDDSDKGGVIQTGADFKMLNLNRAQRKREISAVHQLRSGFQASMKTKVERLFDEEARLVVKAIETGGVGNAIGAVEAHGQEWGRVIEAHWFDVMTLFGKRALDGLKSLPLAKGAGGILPLEFKDAFDLFQQFALQFAKTQGGKKITNISNTTKKGINALLQTAVEENWSVVKLQNAIADMYSDFSASRALTTALTETVGAQNAGQVEAVKQLDSEGLLKVWLWSGVSRATHADADGQAVPVNSKFSVGGEAMAHPGDPDASAKNNVNCHCSVVFEREV